MVTDFQWKLIIAGSVGGACAFFSSVLVFVILACRHQRKQKRLANKRRSRRRLSTQLSAASVGGTSGLARGLDGVITLTDLPFPLPADSNCIRPAWGVGHFWMRQNTLNHDSGFGELESDRADSAVFLQRSFSPSPRSLNSSGMQTPHGDAFPAMSHFDSPWSYSFDLSSPVQPYPCLGYARQNVRPPANFSDVTTPSSVPSGEDFWMSQKSCRSENHIQSSYQECREPDGCLQLVELSHGNSHSRPLHPVCHASIPSSFDDEDSDPVWIRRTSTNMESNLTRQVADSNRTGTLSQWQTRGNQSLIDRRAATRPADVSCGRATSENVVRQKVSALNHNRGAERKQNGFCHPSKSPHKSRETVVCNGRKISK